jgi:hypothetical protein
MLRSGDLLIQVLRQKAALQHSLIDKEVMP